MSSSPEEPERTVLAHEADFHLGAMRARPSRSEIELGGATQHLEPRVMQVLVALVRADGEVLSRDDLIAGCWDGVIVGDDAVSRVISKIRRLSAHDGAGFTIETVPRVGYRLAAGPEVRIAGRAVVSRLRTRIGVRRFLRRWGFMLPIGLGAVAALAVILKFAPELRAFGQSAGLAPRA